MPLTEKLTFFRDARCPQCGGGLPIKVLWDFSRSSLFGMVGDFGLLNGRVGIVCPSCGAKLRVVQTRARVFVVLGWMALLVAAGLAGKVMRDAHVVVSSTSTMLMIGVAVVAAFALQRFLIPHLVRVRLLAEGEHVGFPLERG